MNTQLPLSFIFRASGSALLALAAFVSGPAFGCLPNQSVVRVSASSDVCAPVVTQVVEDGALNVLAHSLVPDPNHFSPNFDLDDYTQEDVDEYSYSASYPNGDLLAGYRPPSEIAKVAQFLEGYGYSLAVRGKTSDVIKDGSAAKTVQVVPNKVIFDPADSSNAMLLTVIFPPGYNAHRAERYPVLLTANGFCTNNNQRALSSTELYYDLLQTLRDGGRGALIAVSNGGGCQATGIQPAGLREIGAAIEYIGRLNGNTDKIVTYGTSRGGITALYWAANPNNYNYKVNAVFARAFFPAIGSAVSAPMNSAPNLGLLLETLYGNFGDQPEAKGAVYALYPAGQFPFGNLGYNEADYRTHGYGDPALSNANSPGGALAIQRLKSQYAAGTLKFVELSVGTKDGFYGHAMNNEYFKKLAAAPALPVRYYVGLAGGHALGGGRALESDLDAYLNLLAGGTGASTPWQPPTSPQRLYYKMTASSATNQVYTRVNPPYTPFSARFPSKETTGKEGLVELVGPNGGSYEVKLLNASGAPLATLAGVFDATESISTRFPMPGVGTYTWTIRYKAPGELNWLDARSHPSFRTPFGNRDNNGVSCFQLLVSTLQPLDSNLSATPYFCNPDYYGHGENAFAFGVDEVGPYFTGRTR